MVTKRNEGIGARFKEWAKLQTDFDKLSNSAAEKRYVAERHERPSPATCGQIMADLRRERRQKDNDAKRGPELDFSKLGNPAVEVGRNGMHTNIPAPVAIVAPGNIFTDMKVVKDAADKVGGYDRLVELARGLKEAGF